MGAARVFAEACEATIGRARPWPHRNTVSTVSPRSRSARASRHPRHVRRHQRRQSATARQTVLLVSRHMLAVTPKYWGSSRA